MITEALRYLTTLARESITPFRITPDNPDMERHLVGGQLVEFPRPLPNRAHELINVQDFANLVGSLHEASEQGGAIVWISDDEVVAVLDDEQRRLDRVTLRMPKTTLFQRIEALGDPMEHRAFLRLLRVDLAGTLAPGTLLEKVKRVDFENGTVVRAKVGRAEESLGKEITGKVTANGELPETVVLEARIWSSYGFTARVPCAVEIDPLRGTLALEPYPDAIENAVDEGLTVLANYLGEHLPSGVGVYRGRPEYVG